MADGTFTAPTNDTAPAHTVEKIGGTSMLKTDCLLENIIFGPGTDSSVYNRAFVVSAYGGVTDMLLEHKKTGEPGVYALFASAEQGWAWGDALSTVAQRMIELNHEILQEPADHAVADEFVTSRIEGVRSCLIDLHRLCSYGHFTLSSHLLTVREMLAALGEAHSAHTTSLLLRRRGVNARFVDLTGWRDEAQPTLDQRLLGAFETIDLTRELPIVSGYAQCEEALMGSFDRGYSEVTFSRLAVLTGAAEAIIHKEFHLSSADPRLVGEEAVQVIGRTNYDVADQLSNMGMEAIHPRAAKGLRQAEIPLRVKNIQRPQDEGTLITADPAPAEARVEIITGLESVYAFTVFDQDMVREKGYDAAILEALTRHSVRIVAKTSNANTITHFLEASPKALKRVENDILARFPAADLTARQVAVVSVIGRNLQMPSLVRRALSALEAQGIEPLGLQLPTRHVDIQLAVECGAFAASVKALHRDLIEAQPEARSQTTGEGAPSLALAS